MLEAETRLRFWRRDRNAQPASVGLYLALWATETHTRQFSFLLVLAHRCDSQSALETTSVRMIHSFVYTRMSSREYFGSRTLAFCYLLGNRSCLKTSPLAAQLVFLSWFY